MLSSDRVTIKLTEEQRKEIKERLGREVTYIIFRLVGGSQVLVEASDAPDTFDGRCYKPF
jgi:hypothetical protein